MMIESVRLHRFRNYEDEVITFPKAIILLYGRNGQGKTNLLESLYMGGIGKSYRGIADADLISWNQDQASVIIQFRRSETRQQLKIILSKTAKKELWVNETKVPQKELVGTLNEVLFSPDDLQLIKGSPSLRRRFMDMEISQVSRSYYQELLQYNRAISQRNLLLKKMKYEGIHPIEEWDRQIAGFAASLVAKRLSALHKLAFLAGGETVVYLTGHGKGGRNQELALAAAAGIAGIPGAAVFSVGSDGTDGPTDAAGGYADYETAAALKAKGLEIFDVLRENDAYHALQAVDGLIITGPTGTNVNDVAVALIG